MVNSKVRLIILFVAKDREALYGQQNTRTADDCSSDHELLTPNSDLNWKKVGKTNRMFGSDLNQIPYDYTVEVKNRIKGLDLIECLKNYGWRFLTLYRRQWSRPSPRKRNAKRQNGCLRKPYKWLRKEEKWKVKEKREDIPIWVRVPKDRKER